MEDDKHDTLPSFHLFHSPVTPPPPLSTYLTQLGRIFHFSFDLVLVSTILAGVKRSTGLTVKTGDFENKDTRSYIERYLDVGEWVFDTSVAFMSTSSYFERRPPRF